MNKRILKKATAFALVLGVSATVFTGCGTDTVDAANCNTADDYFSAYYYDETSAQSDTSAINYSYVCHNDVDYSDICVDYDGYYYDDEYGCDNDYYNPIEPADYMLPHSISAEDIEGMWSPDYYPDWSGGSTVIDITPEDFGDNANFLCDENGLYGETEGDIIFDDCRGTCDFYTWDEDVPFATFYYDEDSDTLICLNDCTVYYRVSTGCGADE